MWKSNFTIDTPARWRGDAGSSLLDGASTAAGALWLISTQVGTGGGLGTARGFGCGGGLGCGGGAGLGGGLGVGFGGVGLGGGEGLGFCSTRGGGGTACGGGFGAGGGTAPEGSLLNLSLNSSAVSSPSKPGPGTK